MYSRRALVLACIALVLAQVESVKVPSSPTVVWKKRASTRMGSQNVLSSSPMTDTMTTVDTVTSSQSIADSISNIQRGGKATTTTMSPTNQGLPDAVKLIIGAGGIYGAFLYYGSLQEDVFRYTAADGGTFQQAWFLQVLEAFANVVVGFLGMQLMGPTKNIPLTMFGISGAAQVTAKACTSLALANGLSFPVATLAKSGKMAPVMAGSLLLGGAKYSLREYLQVAAIIGGTAIVSMGKKKGGSNSMLGVFYIIMSLVFDGVTAGFQKKLKVETAKAGVKPKPYDFMYWTNLFMALTAAVVAIALGEFTSGLAFCTANPDIMSKIIKFSLCSAVGQSFIFYTISNFDPLVLSTVTTTRKIFSVILSILLKGHSLSLTGWSGILLSCGGILSEMQAKSSGKSKAHSH
jgi:UDP-galactose transporter B1